MLVVEEQGNAHRILAEDHFSGIPTDRIELVEALDGLRYLKTGLTGTATADILVGASGNDLITGADGDDLLFGGAGDDTLAGGADDDLLQGGAGADRLAGGTGNDIYRFAFDTDGRDTLSESSGNGTDTLDITDRDIADLGLRRSGTVLVIEDPAGENRVVIEDHFSGIATNRIEIVQGTGALRFFKTGLAGTATSDIIVGASGAETLTGAAGDDILVGGGAKDALYGGAGADVFLFAQISDSTAAAAGRDTIYDFSKSDGDRIALAGIDANTGLAGDNAFVFVGQGPTTGAGTLVYSFAGANTLVQADVNGGGADFSILLAGTLSLSVGDFIL